MPDDYHPKSFIEERKQFLTPITKVTTHVKAYTKIKKLLTLEFH